MTNDNGIILDYTDVRHHLRYDWKYNRKGIAKDVKKVLADTDSLKSDADTVKTLAKKTLTVVQRTEAKVDDLQETADSILHIVDSCCDCNKQPEQKPAPKKKKPVAKPEPCPRDTVIVERPVHDTVYVDKPRQPQDTTRRIMVTCKFKGYVYH